ncbi:SCAN domain-containing protein 3 [Thelohanellus kitauei]|uniref:SCAN domain-containing protein 3 n=1 Tax=Thelohanellus kitauei TaxID=669202 RepID=A0A0C2N7I1_THEKT|nr:SCAN domain-containing protein 3 [Thelohanellus kitauei]
MSEDDPCQLIARLKNSKFAIRLDKSIDIANASQLLVCVRYCCEGEVLEDFMCFKSLPGRTSGEDLFRVLDSFFEDSELALKQCIGVCTDGVAVMTGSKSGLVARVKQAAPHIVSTQCMIHRNALATKNYLVYFKEKKSPTIK